MGTFVKRLGQLAARSLETESANILKTTKANKVPGSLSLKLDGTLKDGHDMKVFGLGTAAALASLGAYSRFTVSMLRVYAAMEAELDGSKQGPVSDLWAKHGDALRRSEALASDLKDVRSLGVAVDLGRDSPGTDAYVAAIRAAGKSHGGAGLLGHLYCRYLADLFGGQMLGGPTKLALGLPRLPRHYHFDLGQSSRREYIETLYADLNLAGERMPRDQVSSGAPAAAVCVCAADLRTLIHPLNRSLCLSVSLSLSLSADQFEACVACAYGAFAHNAVVYREETPLALSAARGVANVAAGAMAAPFRA